MPEVGEGGGVASLYAAPGTGRRALLAGGSLVERKPFNYTDAVQHVVEDIVVTMPEFRHVDLSRVLLSITQARQASTHGVYASLLPLRFECGAVETVVRGRRYRMQPLRHHGREMLYVLYLMLPRFHAEQDYHGKLATLIHELYHISPAFNGDIRRFPGKNFAHGHSREVYHAAMCRLADRYLAASPRARSHEFLQAPFSELLAHPGGLVGRQVSKPRALPVDAPPVKSRSRSR
jgi:hypothetical protein